MISKTWLVEATITTAADMAPLTPDFEQHSSTLEQPDVSASGQQTPFDPRVVEEGVEEEGAEEEEYDEV